MTSFSKAGENFEAEFAQNLSATYRRKRNYLILTEIFVFSFYNI